MGCILKGGGGLYSRVAVGAVLLAAGAGERIGRRPKCLLELGGVPLIRRTLIALSGAGVDEVVVVLGNYADQVRPAVESFPVTVVLNPHPEDGLVSSQRLGLAALTGKLDAVVIALADQPLINSQDVALLICAWKKRPPGTALLQPQVQGQRGNPVIFSSEVAEQIVSADINVGCREWRSRHPELVAAYVTDNHRYRVDIDTLEDLERFQKETGHALHWPVAMAC